MKELNTMQMEEIDGGSMLTYFIYAAIGGAIYKVMTSKSGRISIPRLITFEWR